MPAARHFRGAGLPSRAPPGTGPWTQRGVPVLLVRWHPGRTGAQPTVPGPRAPTRGAINPRGAPAMEAHAGHEREGGMVAMRTRPQPRDGSSLLCHAGSGERTGEDGSHRCVYAIPVLPPHASRSCCAPAALGWCPRRALPPLAAHPAPDQAVAEEGSGRVGHA